MTEFSVLAKQLRKSKGLTQSQLAQRMWMQKSIISAYETDARKPSLDMIIKYAREVGVTTDYLLGLADDESISVKGLTEAQRVAVRSVVCEFLKSNNSK